MHASGERWIFLSHMPWSILTCNLLSLSTYFFLKISRIVSFRKRKKKHLNSFNDTSDLCSEKANTSPVSALIRTVSAFTISQSWCLDYISIINSYRIVRWKCQIMIPSTKVFWRMLWRIFKTSTVAFRLPLKLRNASDKETLSGGKESDEKNPSEWKKNVSRTCSPSGKEKIRAESTKIHVDFNLLNLD